LASACLVFSIVILVAERKLRIDRLFTYTGFYLLCVSLIGMCFTVIYFDFFRTFTREISILVQVFNLSAGFPLIKMVWHVNRDTLSRAFGLFLFIILACMIATAAFDLVLNLGLLFKNGPPLISVGPLYEYLYTPYSVVVFIGACVLLYRTRKQLSGNNRKLVSTLFYGMVCLLPFIVWDYSSMLFYEDPYTEAFWLFGFAILILLVCIISFFIQFIIFHSRISESRKRWEEDPLSKERFEFLKKLILQDKMYQDPDININQLAAESGTPPHLISRLINRYANMNFNSFINSFRLQDFKTSLADPSPDKSILEMGFLSGFNSKTTMNRFFYQQEKMTPRQFREQVLVNNSANNVSLLKK
jgi:AraC-like DNA-binding protein